MITRRDREISVKDILREAGDEEAYVDYIADLRKLQATSPEQQVFDLRPSQE